MSVDELIEELSRIRNEKGNIEVLISARDSGGCYNQYLEVEISVEDDVTDENGKKHKTAITL